MFLLKAQTLKKSHLWCVLVLIRHSDCKVREAAAEHIKPSRQTITKILWKGCIASHYDAIVFLSQQIQIRIQLATSATTPDRCRDTVLMENRTSWYAVIIIGSDFMALFLFYCSTYLSRSVLSIFLSSSPHQKKSFIALPSQQCFHYHLPPLPLSPG